MRLIDADALKELFSEVIGRIAKKPEMNGNLEHMIRASAMVIQMIDDAPSIQPEQRWIPVSEALPEEETDVLVTRTFLGCKDGSHGWNNHIPPTTYVEVAQYFNGEWTALSDEYKIARNRHTNPIAWMPLPEPARLEND